jgi:NADH-quinone oxidoreductase subunit A
MLANYAFIGIFTLAAISFPIVPLVLARYFRPKRPTAIKQSSYECGLEIIGDNWVQFRVQYYLYALSFVIFDVEAVFLIPWAVAYGRMGLLALAAMAVFLLVLVAGLVYEWKKGALEWL